MTKLAICAFAALPLFAGSIPGPGFFEALSIWDTNNTHFQFLVQTNQSSFGYSNTFTANNHQIPVSANGVVSYGSNGFFAQVMNPSVDTFYSQFGGGNTWGDDLIINAPGLTGTAGTLMVSVAVKGTGVGTESANVNTFWQDSVGSDTQLHTSNSQVTSSGTVNTTFTFTIGAKFHYGSPFSFGVTMNVLDAIGLESLTTGDFLHTGLLTGLQPFDSSSNAVSGATFSSASGTSYSTAGVVPEPGSMGMLGVAVLMLSLWRVRRHRSGVSC